MAKSKVYEVEAVIALTVTFEVDATSESNARDVATEALETGTMPFIRKEAYDTYDIDITDVVESEGH